MDSGVCPNHKGMAMPSDLRGFPACCQPNLDLWQMCVACSPWKEGETRNATMNGSITFPTASKN